MALERVFYAFLQAGKSRNLLTFIAKEFQLCGPARTFFA
jgi:hypothetical protein